MGFGRQGERGRAGEQGERGKVGDHGQAGDVGSTGATGAMGPTGQRGPRGANYSSFVTRNVVRAYTLLWVGLILSFVLSGFLYGRAVDQINDRARRQCVAGNTRSDVQREDFAETAAQTQRLDLEKLFNISPEVAADFRRLAQEGADRRIARLPYFDCKTGQRVPPP